MRPIVTLIVVLLVSAGLVGGAVFIGYARLQRGALPEQAATTKARVDAVAIPVPAPRVITPIAKAEPSASVAQSPAPPVRINPTSAPAPTDGSIILLPAAARVHGYKLKVQNQPNPVIRYWVDAQEYVEWPKACPKAGQYDVEITYSCAPGAGGEFAVTAGAAHLRAHTEATADWQTFRTAKLGTLNVANDQTTISLRP